MTFTISHSLWECQLENVRMRNVRYQPYEPCELAMVFVLVCTATRGQSTQTINIFREWYLFFESKSWRWNFIYEGDTWQLRDHILCFMNHIVCVVTRPSTCVSRPGTDSLHATVSCSPYHPNIIAPAKRKCTLSSISKYLGITTNPNPEQNMNKSSFYRFVFDEGS